MSLATSSQSKSKRLLENVRPSMHSRRNTLYIVNGSRRLTPVREVEQAGEHPVGGVEQHARPSGLGEVPHRLALARGGCRARTTPRRARSARAAPGSRRRSTRGRRPGSGSRRRRRRRALADREALAQRLGPGRSPGRSDGASYDCTISRVPSVELLSTIINSSSRPSRSTLSTWSMTSPTVCASL